MSQIKGKTVVITGASSGIGEACALRLGREGAKLMLAARRKDRLEALTEKLRAEGIDCDYRIVDVSDHAQVESLVADAVERFGRIDVLINNAGLMPVSRLEDRKIDEWDRMVDVNIKGVLYGIAAALPRFQAQNSGHFINIASVAGHIVFPAGAVYCGTKHAVRAISEGLRQEAGPHIRTTIISPGRVATELTDTITAPKAAEAMKKAYETAIDADAIARAIAYAIEQPEDVDVNEILIRPTAQER